jgi:hypothetical protein
MTDRYVAVLGQNEEVKLWSLLEPPRIDELGQRSEPPLVPGPKHAKPLVNGS